MSPDAYYRHMLDAFETADEHLSIARSWALGLKECLGHGRYPERITRHQVDAALTHVLQRTEGIEEGHSDE